MGSEVGKGGEWGREREERLPRNRGREGGGEKEVRERRGRVREEVGGGQPPL